MNQLKAFVGHSFIKEDEEVVRAFLDFFNHVKEIGIGFDWEHAKPAEPKALAEKVKELTRDKNVFIGICTKRERVVEPEKLKQGKLRKGTLRAHTQDLLWKTSDWLIQEIGLCIGRGMAIILLVEEGLRQPGGLQGDLEYIAFDRSSPEKCFNKILEMIRALIPKAGAILKEPIEPSAKVGMEKQEEKKGSDWLRPKEDWSRWQYEVALMHMVRKEDQEGEQMIVDCYLATKEGQVQENKIAWEAAQEYFKIWLGKGGSLEKLESLEKAHPDSSEITGYLAKAFQVYEEHGKAAVKFQSAAAKEPDPPRKLTWLSKASFSFSRAGDNENCRLTIQEMRVHLQNVGDGEIVILNTLRNIAEADKDRDMYFACSERLLDLHPDEGDIRFRLAFEYSETGRDDLALFHYTRIPYQKRSSASWNNIGVANARLGLDSKAVEAYKRAEELCETLAMSNLAKKLINAGFLSEAGSICERAIKLENYDKEVGSTISTIKTVQKEETEKQEKLLAETKKYREFYKNYGHACSKASPQEHMGVWEGPRCKLALEIKDDKLTAEGSFEVPSLNALASALSGWKGVLPTSGVNRNFIRYKGILTGLAVKCQVTVEGDGQAVKSRSLLTETAGSKEALMIISEDLNEIRVYEKDAPEAQKFYLLKRIES